MTENPNEIIEVAGDIEKAKSMIQEAREQAAKLRAENDRTEAIALRMEAAKVQYALGGSADAGQVPIPKAEQTKAEKAIDFFGDSQLSKDIKRAAENE
jgi:hypothetical protein